MSVALQESESSRGPWPTGLALVAATAPLTVATLLGMGASVTAIRLGSNLQPFLVSTMVILVLAYPTVAAMARRMAYAPTTVIIVASIVPAILYAGRLLLNRVPTDAAGRSLVTPELIAQRALPPAILAIGTFVAIDLASGAVRRGVAVGVFGAIAAAIVFAGSFLVPLGLLFDR